MTQGKSFEKFTTNPGSEYLRVFERISMSHLFEKDYILQSDTEHSRERSLYPQFFEHLRNPPWSPWSPNGQAIPEALQPLGGVATGDMVPRFRKGKRAKQIDTSRKGWGKHMVI